MKTVLRSTLTATALLLLAGCYTELATIEPGEHHERDYPYATDTVSENGNVTINNHYYLDDDYRRSRLRVSLNYYYPSYTSSIGAYYGSYFDDNYWGMYHRPSWYYDPFSPWYCPPVYYPSPYYDPWYPYYPPISYYPAYYPGYYSGTTNTPIQPGRPRSDGPTRDPNSSDRPRPTSPNIPVAGPVTERPTVTEGRPVETTRPARQPETPWWEKLPNERPVRDPNGEARPTEGRPVTRPSGEERPVGSPRPTNGGNGAEDRPVTTTRPIPAPEGRPAERPVGTTASPRPSVGEDRPVEQPKRPAPSYTPPPPSHRPSGNDEARPAERPRESRQPSYTPAPHSAPPQSTPPRSSGGTGNGGRRRD